MISPLRRIGRKLTAPWRWVCLQEARHERRRRNDARSIRRVFAALNRRLDADIQLACEIRRRLDNRPAFRLCGGELVPLAPAAPADTEGGHCD